MSLVDQWVNRLPGSVGWKAFGTAVVITVACAIPFMNGMGDKRQGHNIFSSDKPEVIAAQQDQERRQQRLQQQ